MKISDNFDLKVWNNNIRIKNDIFPKLPMIN